MAAPGHIRQRGGEAMSAQEFVCNAFVLVSKLWSWEGPGRIIGNSGGSWEDYKKSWRVLVILDNRGRSHVGAGFVLEHGSKS